MSVENKIYLNPSCILTVPLEIYDDEFLFIVNGKEFKTNKIISDLLSPVICKNHITDSTMNKFIIETHNQGDFSHILELVKFNHQNFNEDELPFIIEVIDILCNKSIEINTNIEITVDNVFNQLKLHEKKSNFFSQNISKEIEFISSHFNELCESHREEFKDLSIDTMIEIINNDQLSLKSEDQLLKFVNFLYLQNSQYLVLYELVYFENVTGEMMKEFLQNYDNNDMSRELWNRLSKRLEQEIKLNQENDSKQQQTIRRYQNLPALKSTKGPLTTNETVFTHSNEKEFDGIFNYLRQVSNGEISDEIKVTASSYSMSNSPQNAIIFDDNMKFFCSNDSPNSWIKFDFKNHKVKPSSYTIKTRNLAFPRSWAIEGSNDDNQWQILDAQNDCQTLRKRNIIHTFMINSENIEEFKCIRMRLTGPNWSNSHCFLIGSFELYGTLS